MRTELRVPEREQTDSPGVWKRGSRYQVWYVCSGCKPDGSCPGHTETQPAGTLLREAKARRAELVSKVSSGGKLVGKKVRLSVYAPEWLATQKGNLKPKTVDTYDWAIRVWIVPSLGQRMVSEITIDDVARLITKMKSEGRKAWTIRAVLTPLSRMMSHAVRGGLAASNPVRGLDKSERPKGDQRQMRILTSEEIARLLPAVPDSWRPLITFLLFTGLRISEALNVRWQDIDLESGTVTVTESKTQAGTGRSVILIPALTSVLRRHRLRSRYSASGDYVFPNTTGGMLNRHYLLAKILKPALEAANCPEITTHELRHTFASLLVGMGMDVTFVADQLGHSDPAITLRVYSQLFNPEARRQEAKDKLQEAFGGSL